MCGIFGFFSHERRISTGEIRSALSSLRHRGPDNSGVVCFDHPNSRFKIQNSKLLSEGEWSSVLAHTRLSIIDLSDAANQPMCNEDESIWLAYNGEIYNFAHIREELTRKGHIFRSRTDSEVIIHGYEEWGTDVLSRLRGMFAFALLDRKQRRLFLVRDRLGVKPLKYYVDDKTIIFASELKPLMHLIPHRMDLQSLNVFLTLKYTPSPGTIMEGVKKLGPAELLECDLETMRVSIRKFWTPEFYPKVTNSFREAQEHFRDLLSESVLMRMVADVPVGVYLSGGMDSSAIVAFLRKGGIENLNTFTIKFDRPGYDESGYAAAVAKRFGTRHHEFMTPELTYGELENIIHSLDEPFGDPSYIPTYFLSRDASEHVKVILSGDGGDEILGGYKRYHIYARSRMLSLLPPMNFGFLKRIRPEINKKSLVGKLQRLNEELSLGYWGAYLLRFNGFSDSFRRVVMLPEVYDALAAVSLDGLISNFSDSESISDTIERLTWIDMHTYLPDYILTKTDLALMAHSVEGRNPLVDYRLVEYANVLPPEFKFRHGGKHILKSLLEEYLPHDIIHRKKMGFSPPIKYWFRDNLSLLNQIFSESEFVSGDIFDLKRIHRVIEEFKRPEVNVSEQLWLLIVLELWRRQYRI